jgi:hypothetical protein
MIDKKERGIALKRLSQKMGHSGIVRERLAENGVYEMIAEYVFDADDKEVYSLTLLKVELFVSGEPIDILPQLSPTQRAAVMETLSIY